MGCIEDGCARGPGREPAALEGFGGAVETACDLVRLDDTDEKTIAGRQERSARSEETSARVAEDLDVPPVERERAAKVRHDDIDLLVELELERAEGMDKDALREAVLR